MEKFENDMEFNLYITLLPLAYDIYKGKTNGMVCGTGAEEIRDKMFKSIKDSGILTIEI